MKTKLTSAIVALATCALATAEPPKGEGKKRPEGPRQVPKEILEKFDKDGDGKLSKEERQAAMEARKAEMLKKYDKDGDGKLSKEEREAIAADRKAEFMKKYDTDGDGKLSDEEKAAARKAMGDRRGGSRERGKGGAQGRQKGKGGPKKGKPADE